MNHFTLRTEDGDDKSIVIKSTLDKSHFLAPKTYEEVQLDDDALVIIKNQREDTQTLSLVIKAMNTSDAHGKHTLIVMSSRRSTLILHEGDEIDLNIDGGEVLQIRTNVAKNPGSAGAGVAV